MGARHERQPEQDGTQPHVCAESSSAAISSSASSLRAGSSGREGGWWRRRGRRRGGGDDAATRFTHGCYTLAPHFFARFAAGVANSALVPPIAFVSSAHSAGSSAAKLITDGLVSTLAAWRRT